MKGLRLLVASLLPLAAAASTVGAEPESTRARLRSAVTEGRLAEAVRVFEGLAHPTARDQYFTGFALMELNKPQEAEFHLRSAKEAGFRSWKEWPAPDLLLDRVRRFRSLSPPLRTVSSRAQHPSITVCSGPPTSWSTFMLEKLPEIEAAGRAIFGKDLPSIRLYLFDDRKKYERFFEALFDHVPTTEWQTGTGACNVVVYFKADRPGSRSRAEVPETIADVLHEFGHAWIHTYLIYRHDKDWDGPPWLGEGLAELIASLREPALMFRRANWLKEKVANGARAPTFKEIQDWDGFYRNGDVEVHYWMSALFVADLIGPRDRAPETIRRILDAAGRSGNVLDALRAVAGKDLRREFERVVRRFW